MDDPTASDATSILVVDDDADLRTVAAAMLAARGFATRVAADAAEAMAVLEAHPIDVLLTDLSLPGVQGDVFALTIQRGWPQLAVIALTGFDTPSTRVRCRYAQVDVYLRKPVPAPAVLEQAVRTALRRRRERAGLARR